MIIGCEVGGVIKGLYDDLPFPDAISSLFELQAAGHTIIFITSCKELLEKKIRMWLTVNDLNYFELVCCPDYETKVQIAIDKGVTAMIDAEMSALKLFPVDNFMRIWFCRERKKILTAEKHAPKFYETVHLVQSWNEIISFLL